MSVVVGIDLGYGDTKVIGVNGDRIRFPSRWAKHDGTQWGIGGNIPILSVDDSQDHFAFGDDASGPNAREPLGDGRLADKASLPLIAAALWASGAGSDGSQTQVVLGSGTPLGTFDKELADARTALEGRTLKITSLSGEVRQLSIDRLVMRPQGVGAALYMIENGLMKQQKGLATVIDIGSRTTDVLTLNLMTMEPVLNMSFSITTGIGDSVSEIAKAIARDAGFVVPTDVARESIASTVMYKQKEVGGPEFAAPFLQELADRIIDNMRANLRSELDRVTALIPVGGGAALIGDKLESLAPGAIIKVPEEDLPFANALGYKDAAKREVGQ